MIKAGALVFALAISLLVAMISGSLILLSWSSTMYLEMSLKTKRLIRNTESGLTLLLSEQQLVPADSSMVLDLFGDGTDSVLLLRHSWGAFEIISSKAFSHGDTLGKTAVCGYGLDADTTTALITADLDQPLSLCGKTILKGDVKISKVGFKRAYVEGKNFEGSQFVQGNTLSSSRYIPPLNPELTKSLLQGFSTEIFNKDSLVFTDISEIPDSLANSFQHKTICYQSTGTLLLGHQQLSGNIRIIAGREIIVEKECVLKDILLYAPRIRIKEGFKGNLQAFATDTLIMEKNVTLDYPSVVAVIRIPRSPDMISLIIGEGSSVSGAVIAYEEKYHAMKQVNIRIEKKVSVFGIVYSSGDLDLKAEVSGLVCCNKFVLRTNSGVYDHHLLDAVIDRSKLPSYFLCPDLFEDTPEKKIMKWL